jgi:hypothetical protein
LDGGMSEDGKTISGKQAEEILKEARARFKLASEAESDNREAALADLEFLDGDQWSEQAKEARKGRPQLTINRLPQYVRQVVNEQRKTRPAIDVIPGDSKAGKATANVIQGMVRHIERSSRARIAYDTAVEYAVSCGFGHFRVTTGYVDDDSFDQEIRIETIDNPFLVYRDPASKEGDHSDDRFSFVSELVDKDEFKERFGFAPTEFADAGTGDDIAPWFDGDRVRVAEYWRVECEDVTLTALSDGTVLTTSLTAEQKAQVELSGVTVLGSRQSEKRTVEQYLLTADKVIKKTEWRGRYIPILTSYGSVINIAGERKVKSLIRDAKDPARMYNYQASAETELVALQPKAPWLGAEGSFDGLEEQYARAHVDNLPYLEYVPVPGQPPPQRQFFAGLPAGVREGRMAAAEDIKATLGMYDASLGAKSNETSGVAIKARQQEGDTGTFHFIDNHARSIEQCGRIIIDLLPKIYDTARVVRILSPTDESETVVINQTFVNPATNQEEVHNLSEGRYEVAVRVGPSFESARQEMVQAMLELSTANPQILQVAGDLIMKNMDFPQSEEIAKRLELLLPPAVRGEQPAPSPEQQLVMGQVKVEEIKAQALLAKSQADLQGKGGDMQMKQGEMQLQQQEMVLKQQEMQLRQQEALANAQVESERLQLEREKIQLEREKIAATLFQSAQAQQLQPMDMEQGEAMPGEAAQIVASVQQLAEQFAQVAQAMLAPKQTRLVHGQDGRPMGSVTESIQ